ncbi:MAG: ABC transporter permease, partial [Alphaproteobacteria bacterium]|nr:ABC transporter permease [Alphaproteobacteria bacterium]
MLRYLAQRVLLMVPTLLGVALLVFFMLRVMPGDIVELKLKADGAAVTQDVLDAERARLGLDKPLHVQLVAWLGGMLVGDMGTSMWTGQPVAYEIAIRFELSIQVAFMATLIAVSIAIPLGTAAALFKDTWIDYGVRVLAIAGLAVPSFWLGMIIILTLLLFFS